VDSGSRRETITIDPIELLLLDVENLTVAPKLINRATVEARLRLRKWPAIKPEHGDPFGMPLDGIEDVIVEQCTERGVRIRLGSRRAWQT
jgi:hypothetical protein